MSLDATSEGKKNKSLTRWNTIYLSRAIYDISERYKEEDRAGNRQEWYCHLLSAHKPQSVEQVFATCKQGSSKIAHVNRKASKGQNLNTTQHEYTNLH
ncbi:4'-demethylrebeccamycin synthase [Fusarium oxysporum f. sp. albedinis]|nr:4'-demethylrebeccamycin synthase [Fusarium oxysporum f. sp. albedinis]